MSRKKEEKKETIPIDYLTETKMMSYTISLRESEIRNLKSTIEELKTRILNYEKDIADLKLTYVISPSFNYFNYLNVKLNC